MARKDDELKKKTNEELIKIIEEQNKKLKDQKKLVSEINNMNKEQLASYSKMTKDTTVALKAEAELAIATGRRADAIKAAREAEEMLGQMRAASLSRSEALEKKQIEINDLIAKGGAAAMAEAKKLQEELDKQIKTHEEIDKNQKEIIDNLTKTKQVVEDMVGPIEEISDKWEEFGGNLEDTMFGIGEKLIGLVDHTNHWTGALTNGMKMLAADPAKGIEQMAAAFAKTFSPMNIMATLMDKVVESTLEMITGLDKASAKFAAATGSGSQYTGMLHDMTRANNHLGLTFENSAAGLQGMLENLIGFTNESPAAQQALASQAGLLERVGIKAEDSADLMNTFSKTMGLGAEASMNMTKKLAFMGDRIGISSNRMIKDFQRANQSLAVYGKKGVGIFQNLAAGAKAAGVEMGTLLGIAEQFDTFESAAESAGKLNAILGGNLSATQLLMQTEDERVETVIRQIQISGQSFAQMDRFKQKALANAVGITDMAEANRIFGMSMSQYKGYQKDMKANELSQKKFEEAVKATVPIQEKLAAMMMEFAPDVTAALEYIRIGLDKFISGLKFLNKESKGTFPYIIMGLGFVLMASTALGGAVGLLSKAFVGLKGIWQATTAVAKAFNLQTLIGNRLTKISAFFSGLMKKLRIDEIRSQYQKIAANKAENVSTIANNSIKPTQIALTKAQGQASAAAAKKVWAIAGAMLAAGAAMLMLGYGIKIAAEGLATLVSSFALLSGEQINAAVYAIAMLTGVFAALMVVMGIALFTGVLPATAGAFMAIGGAAALFGLGILLASAGIALILDSIGKMGEGAVIAAVAFQMIAASTAIMVLAFGAALIPMYFFTKVAGGAAAVTGILAVGMLLLGLAMVLVSFLLPTVVEGIVTIAGLGEGAATVISSLGKAFATMAIGLGAMFAFMSNPIGWAAIAGALVLMASGIAMLVGGISKLDGEKLAALSNMADKLGVATEVERTIIAVLADDIEVLKDAADAKLAATLGSLALLEAYQTVFGINNIKAETKVEEKKVMEQKLTLNLMQEIALGKDKKFSEHVKDGMEVVFKPGGNGEALAETIVAKGTGEAAKLAGG